MKSSPFQVIFLVILGFIGVIAVLIFSGIIPGVGTLSQGDKPGKVTLWGTYNYQGKINDFIGDFNLDNKDKVTITYEAKAPETYLADLIEAFARGEGPDMFFVDQTMLNALVGKTTDIPFTTVTERVFQDTFTEGSRVFLANNGIKALPLLVDPLVMYYNKTMYASAGLAVTSKTWTELLTTLKPLNQIDLKNNLISRTAVALGEWRNIRHAKAVLSSLMLQAGTPLVSLDSTNNYFVTLTNDYGYAQVPAAAATEFYLSFSNPTNSNYSWNRSLPNDLDAFTAENLATYFGLASDLKMIQSKNPHLSLDSIMVPQQNLNRRAVFGNFYGVTIANNSKNKDYALSAALLLTNAKYMQKLSEVTGMSPVRRDLLAKPATDRYQQTANDSAIVAYSWVDPNQSRTNILFQAALENIQTGQMKTLDAIKSLNDQLGLLFNKVALPTVEP